MSKIELMTRAAKLVEIGSLVEKSLTLAEVIALHPLAQLFAPAMQSMSKAS